MPYDIGMVDYIGEGRLRINAEKRRALCKSFGEDQAEQNFLYDDDCVGEVEELPGRTEELIILQPLWVGMGSNTSLDNFYEALAETHGAAELLLTWQGGDLHTGLRVVDGKVTEHEVVFTLGAEVQS